MQDLENYGTYSRPELAKKLSLIGLDITFSRANGAFLYYELDGKEIEVLDLVGGYGALLWGHNHPDLVSCLKNFFENNYPNLAQMSIRKNTALLAKALSDELSNQTHETYISTFVNSGSEAVETALKHAALSKKYEIDHIVNNVSSQLSEIKHIHSKAEFSVEIDGQKKTLIYNDLKNIILKHNDAQLSAFLPSALITEGAYHGKTISALSLTANQFYQTPIFHLPKLRTISISESTNLEEVIEAEWIDLYCPKINSKQEVKIERIRFNAILLFLIEPIRGEAGILPFSIDFLKMVEITVRKANIPLVADEIQTGFYRCGYLSYLKSLDLNPDYILLSKSMGGGLAKIGLCVIGSKLYQSEFSMMHTSTFGDDELSGAIAIKALSLGKLHSKDILLKANKWKSQLSILEKKHKNICQIRSIGLMIGIEISSMFESDSFAFQVLSRSGYLGYLASSFLLHQHRIRVSVTLSNPHTIRLHPSMLIGEDQIKIVMSALDDFLTALSYNDLYYLSRHLLKEEFQNLRPLQKFENKTTRVDTCHFDSEVAFIVHYISSSYLPFCEPSLSHLSLDVIESLLNIIVELNQAAILGKRIVKSQNGKSVRVTFVGLPYSTEMIRQNMVHSRKSIEDFRSMCNNAIQLCHQNKLFTIGLGQFNSIAMRNGKDVISEQALITSGNGLTIYAAYASVLQYLDVQKAPIIAVVGAGGNIALTLSEMILPHCESMIVLGSSLASEDKINKHVEYLKSLNTKANIFGGWDIKQIKNADIVLIATSSTIPFIGVENLKVGSLVVDLSIPSNCHDNVRDSHDIYFVNGGLINLPNGENIDITGIPLCPGQSFACLAETMLMGLENCSESYSYSTISTQNVLDIGAIARKHGFVVALPEKVKFQSHVALEVMSYKE